MPVTAPTRRTQADRRARTISLLLDATIDSIADVGYAATTMRAVAQRAGVSHGAAKHHFPARLDLIAAAIEEIANRRLADARSQIVSLPRAPAARLRACLDLLHSGSRGPLFAAWVRLWVAAAEDEDLHERMRPIEKRLWRTMREIVTDALPDLAADRVFEARLAVMMATLRGLGFQEHFDPLRDERSHDPWPAYRAALELLLTAPSPGQGGRTLRAVR